MDARLGLKVAPSTVKYYTPPYSYTHIFTLTLLPGFPQPSLSTAAYSDPLYIYTIQRVYRIFIQGAVYIQRCAVYVACKIGNDNSRECSDDFGEYWACSILGIFTGLFPGLADIRFVDDGWQLVPVISS